MTSKIPEQFIPRPRSMLESDAYRSLSLSAHRMMARIELEHLKHGGKDNGRLPVTIDDLVAYGVRRSCVADARRELVAAGFVRITRKGRASSGQNRFPTLYRLTYIHADNKAPTNEWKRHGNDPQPSSGVHRTMREKPQYGKRTDTSTENVLTCEEAQQIPSTENVLTPVPERYYSLEKPLSLPRTWPWAVPPTL